MGEEEQARYDAQASAYCRTAIVLWLIGGWIYAAVSWRLLILPGVLVFFPGIFVAGQLAFALFLPSWHAKKRLARWRVGEPKQWGTLLFATVWLVVQFAGPIGGAILFVEVARQIVG